MISLDKKSIEKEAKAKKDLFFDSDKKEGKKNRDLFFGKIKK